MKKKNQLTERHVAPIDTRHIIPVIKPLSTSENYERICLKKSKNFQKLVFGQVGE
jgi:hypothetical protein